MYLKKLEIQGFKSFADKTVLEFMPGITSVIGPNGSGKSNISDAIRWVLGEQSMKSLRGSKSEDIIFAGTQNRRSLGFAETSITIDNSDGKLPIEYSEVTVTRKLYRSGDSEYYINKTQCRLKDIQELFMDTGIGKDGYSIIGQGKIDEILSNNSVERRHIFEEAAGIVKYRVRKNDSEKKLEQTKNNLIRIQDIVLEIENNIEPLRISSEKAKQFLSLREELKKIEVGLFIDNIEKNKTKLEESIADEEVLTNQQIDEEKILLEKQALKEELKNAINMLTEKIEETQNLGFEYSGKQEKLNSEKNMSLQKIDNNLENIERLTKEIEETKNKIIEIEQDKIQKLEKKERMFSSKETFENDLKQKEQELAGITSKLSSKELEIEEKRKELEEKTELKNEEKNNITLNDANFENLEKREIAIKREIQDNIYELDANKIKNEEDTKNFYEIESKRTEIVKKIEEINIKKQECEEKLKGFDNNINTFSHEYRMADSKHKFLIETEKEKEGYIKSVKSLLIDCEKNASLGKGMYGIFGSLITVPRDYELALEMCLGASLQNIVTDTETDAKRLIEHLRENNLGRVSFLPIDAVKGKELEINITEIKKKCNGVIDVASKLIEFDKKYQGIVLNLLGRTIVVDNMDTGIKLAKEYKYSFRIVTLLGDILNSSGQITGGSTNSRGNRILGRAREIEELEEKINKLQKDIDKITKAKEEYILSMSELVNEFEDLERNLRDVDVTYEVEKQKFDFVETIDIKIKKRIEDLKQEQEDNIKEREEIKNKKEEINLKIESLEKEISELNVAIEEFSNANKYDLTIVDNLNEDITNLKISVSSFYESGASIDELITMFDNEILNSNNSIKNKEEQKINIANENLQLQENIKKIEEKIKQLIEDSANSGQVVENLKKERTEKNQKLVEVENNVENQFKVIEGLKEQLLKIDLKKSKINLEIEAIVNKMWEEYELTPNQAGEYEKPENVSETTKKVNVLRAEIKELGSINIDSIEEYKKTKERYDFLTEQRLDLENTSEKLRKIITDMTVVMRKQFSEQFKLINQNFGKVFAELFGGGKAELKLVDENNILECGIDIEAQPPGKKLQNMMLLSGGERAFTAIALLFAILKLNPAPFCVLDEIEAALDDVNVYRFSEYIKRFTNNTQFLVITHRKGTMESADTLYGVTMEENGISKLLSIKLK